MGKRELEEVIDNGMKKLQLKIDKNVKEQMIEFSSEFPHYIHLLSKYGAKELIENDKINFSESYLNIAIRAGIENTSEQSRISYREAISTSNNSNKWKDLLFACVDCEIDEFNAFTITEVVRQYTSITNNKTKNTNLNYNLNQLTTESRGEILVKLGKGKSTKYMFNNPMMRAFVKLKKHSI